ncbi:MAG: aspartate aminotransferase family protein, partial [bacterium]
MPDFLEIEKSFSFDVYPKRNVVLVRGQNALVWDDKGQEYIDCVCGHGVANLGHANEKVIAAIHQQSKQLITCSNVFYNERRALLMEKLIAITPPNLTRVFLCNSGTEAVEAALKFARFTTKKTDFVSAIGSFHGRSFGALSATFKPEYRTDFEPLVPGFSFVPFNDFEELQGAVTEKTAGILLEVVQGEGGVNVGDEKYFQQVRELCDETGVLLIIDEIQSGFCRTGKMFASDYYDLDPDIMCLAKAIAGGLPMGATVCCDKIDIPVGKHGTTFGGNPLACATALAAIDYMLEKDL